MTQHKSNTDFIPFQAIAHMSIIEIIQFFSVVLVIYLFLFVCVCALCAVLCWFCYFAVWKRRLDLVYLFIATSDSNVKHGKKRIGFKSVLRQTLFNFYVFQLTNNVASVYALCALALKWIRLLFSSVCMVCLLYVLFSSSIFRCLNAFQKIDILMK